MLYLKGYIRSFWTYFYGVVSAWEFIVHTPTHFHHATFYYFAAMRRDLASVPIIAQTLGC